MIRPPFAPYLHWRAEPSENGYANIRVTWEPSLNEGRLGSHFYVKYRKRKTAVWEQTSPVLDEDWTIVRGLFPDEVSFYNA